MERKIRIAHITQAMGGVKTHIKYIVQYVNHERFEFDIIAPHDEDFKKFANDNTIKYLDVPLVRNVSFINDTRAFFKILTLLRKGKYDIVHLHSAKASAIGRIACFFSKQKNVFTPNGFSYLSTTGASRAIYLFIEGVLKNKTNKLFAVSNSEANRGLYELGFKRDTVTVIENSIVPFEKEETYAADRDVKVISTIGRLTFQKNLIKFLEIAKEIIKKYPNVKFRILGAGYHDDQRIEIEDYIAKNDISRSVEIIEWSYDYAIMKYLTETDIYISTSVFEGLPYSLIEAMSLGIPCVASMCDGNNDAIQNNVNGFLCNSHEQFIAVLHELFENKDIRMRISRNAISTVQTHFNIKINAKKLESEYAKIAR